MDSEIRLAFNELKKGRGYEEAYFSDYRILELATVCPNIACGATCEGFLCSERPPEKSVKLVFLEKTYMIESGDESEICRAEEILARYGFEKAGYNLAAIQNDCAIKIKKINTELRELAEFNNLIK